jgi:hypothetical protein
MTDCPIHACARRVLLALALPLLAALVGAAAPPGAITSVAEAPDGGAVIAGWACQATGAPAPVVRLSAGGPRSPGQPIADAVANRPAPGGAGPCAGGAARGFAASLSRATLFRYGDLPVSAAIAAGPLAGATDLPAWRAVGTAPRNCTIRDMGSLRSCFARPDAYDRFVFAADVSCAGAACCTQPDRPPMELIGVHGKLIEGNGHALRRRGGGQFACPALLVLKSADIAVNRLTFDEDSHEPACELDTKPCAPTVRVQSAHDVRLTRVRVQAGKGYVVYVWNTDGFAFIRSVISDAGIIGLYVGHYKYGPSRNVVVADSVIAHSRTNGLALQGAQADSPDAPVLVMDNIFSANHWHGLWPVAGVPGGITTGGQVLVADGHNIRLTGNIVANGACGNCKPPRQTVAAIELGDQTPLPAGVFGLTIDHNILLDGAGTAIAQNPGTAVTQAVLRDNLATGFIRLDSLAAPAVRAGNALSSTPPGVPRPAGLAPAPAPGDVAEPLVWCVRPGNGGAVTAAAACTPPGRIAALLGYPKR